jgi:multisubunit Na+/H+ antiporter MnhB subunit
MMRKLAQTFYRLIGLAFTMLGMWVLFVNLVEDRDPGWILVWILSAGFIGALGGILFLLSFDGPERFRSRQVRFLGWLGMLFLGVLPWSFQFVMLPLVLLVLPAMGMRPQLRGQASPKIQS